MLEIRKAEEKDIYKLKTFLKNTIYEKINIKSRINDSMIVLLDNDVVGFASYKEARVVSQEKYDVLLDIILIKEEFRGQYIGDGLVRAILNLIKNRGNKIVFTLVSDKNLEFIKKLGFQKTNIDDNDNINDNYYLAKELEIYQVDLEEFFNKPCRSSTS